MENKYCQNQKITEYLVSRLNDQLDNPGYIFEIEEVIKPPFQVHVSILFKSILERYKNEDSIMIGASFLNTDSSLTEQWQNNVITSEEYFDLVRGISVSDEQIDDLYKRLNDNLIYHLQNKTSNLQKCLDTIGVGINTEFGYCRIGYEEDYAHIYDLYIFPECRNQGKAKEILLKAIERIKDYGYDEIQIVCNPTEEGIDKNRLRKLYESFGLKTFEYYG